MISVTMISYKTMISYMISYMILCMISYIKL